MQFSHNGVVIVLSKDDQRKSGGAKQIQVAVIHVTLPLTSLGVSLGSVSEWVLNHRQFERQRFDLAFLAFGFVRLASGQNESGHIWRLRDRPQLQHASTSAPNFAHALQERAASYIREELLLGSADATSTGFPPAQTTPS